MNPQFTGRQAKAWPEAVAEAQRYVDTSDITPDLGNYFWDITWEDETRPGRGHQFSGTWNDGEYLVQIMMDVYGCPSVSVAELSWLHNSSDEECACEPCTAERYADEP